MLVPSEELMCLSTVPRITYQSSNNIQTTHSYNRLFEADQYIQYEYSHTHSYTTLLVSSEVYCNK